MNELWKFIPDVGNKCSYFASEDGRIKSVWHTKKRIKTRILSQYHHWSGNGYMHVKLGINNTYTVQGLMAKAGWLGPKPSDLHEINHKDTDKTNNHANNLEWNTKSENMQHAVRHSLVNPPKGGDHSFARKIGRYFNSDLVESYDSVRDAERQGYSRGGIEQAASNGWVHKGFHWAFLEGKTRNLKRRERRVIAIKDGVKIEYANVHAAKIGTGADISNLYKALKSNATIFGIKFEYA